MNLRNSKLFQSLVCIFSSQKNYQLVFACIIFIAFTGQSYSQAKINMNNRYQINKDGSYITFKTSFAGFPVIRGGIKSYQATIFYDPNDIMKSSATIRIASPGFTTSHDKRDTELQGKHFLNSKEFPSIWFQGFEAKPTKDGFDLNGTMNIKNINKPVTIHLKKPILKSKAMRNLDIMIVNGHFSISRKDFKLGATGPMAGNPMLGDKIDVEFSFLCFRYTVDYIKAAYVEKVGNIDHAVGLIYNEVKKNGANSGLNLLNKLLRNSNYKSDNWLSNLANIGWLLMVDGLGKEALPFYHFALEKNPNHLVSNLRLGDAYVFAGEYDKALVHYKKERSLDARKKFTHIPHMIKLISGSFKLKDMR